MAETTTITTSIASLTTIFTPPPWCAGRYAVFIDHVGPMDGTSTNVPTSGWVDPSFSSCIPAQYTTTYPTFSPGVCPDRMNIVSSASNVNDGKTVWTGACCESGFSTMETDPRFICTSLVTTPMPFLLDPYISTADVYTTLSNLWIEHDQIAVQWEQSDLPVLPSNVAVQYAFIMGVAAPTSNAASGGTSSVPAQTIGTPTSPRVTLTSDTALKGTGSSRAFTSPEITSLSQTTNTPTATRVTSSKLQSTSSSSASTRRPRSWFGWIMPLLVYGVTV